jgi:hypothetical protein
MILEGTGRGEFTGLCEKVRFRLVTAAMLSRVVWWFVDVSEGDQPDDGGSKYLYYDCTLQVK